MITVESEQINGVLFYKNVHILEPDDTVNGVSVHRINKNGAKHSELIQMVKAQGLREVGFDDAYRAYLYAEYPISYWRFKLNDFLIRNYWATIRWLYKNARFFQEIPVGERFSWRYFTFYHWLNRKK